MSGSYRQIVDSGRPHYGLRIGILHQKLALQRQLYLSHREDGGDAGPCPILPPEVITAGNGGPGTEARCDLPPRAAAPHEPDDTTQYPPRVRARAAPRACWWEHREQAVQQRIVQRRHAGEPEDRGGLSHRRRMRAGAAGAMRGAGDGLMPPAPHRPAQAGGPAVGRGLHQPEQAQQFRDRQRDQGAWIVPLSPPAARSGPPVRAMTSAAWARSASVMWRCQALQPRTSY